MKQWPFLHCRASAAHLLAPLTSLPCFCRPPMQRFAAFFLQSDEHKMTVAVAALSTFWNGLRSWQFTRRQAVKRLRHLWFDSQNLHAKDAQKVFIMLHRKRSKSLHHDSGFGWWDIAIGFKHEENLVEMVRIRSREVDLIQCVWKWGCREKLQNLMPVFRETGRFVIFAALTGLVVLASAKKVAAASATSGTAASRIRTISPFTKEFAWCG